MDFFHSVAEQIPEYRELTRLISENRKIQTRENSLLPVTVTGLSRVHKAHFLSALVFEKPETIGLPLLALVETENEALRLCEDINTFAGNMKASVYPAKDLNLIAAAAVSREYEHRRLSILANPPAVILATPEAAAQYTIPPEELNQSVVEIKSDTEINRDGLLKKLVEAGYERCDMIEGAGQFAVRGDIIDVYAVNLDYPVRIELWGDVVDSVNIIDIESQRRVERISVVRIAPAVEKEAYREEATLFDYVKSAVVCENVNCAEQFRAAEAQLNEEITLLLEQGKEIKQTYILGKARFNALLSEKTKAYFNTFARSGNHSPLNVSAIQIPAWNGEYSQLKEDLTAFLNAGNSVVVFAGTEKSARALANDLRDDNFPADYSEAPKKIYARRAYVTAGTLSNGYSYAAAKCVCLTHYGTTRDYSGGASAVNKPLVKPKKRSKKQEIRAITDINVGDYVVHDNYGIGVFEGVTKLTSEDNVTGQKVSKDYIKIRYAGKDALYVPVTQLDFISRYIGNTDTASLKLSKLHTDSWSKAKSRAKKAADELAEELIELYTKRLNSKGHAFALDSREQEEFENRFAYIETEDQLRCIVEIKSDMHREQPMDRLLCGDVGFGKTEVALRAAFKCVTQGFQCALLCPTTVLAWQHYQTAAARFQESGFPVNIELLSRFRTAKEQKQILEKLKKGVADFVIGTHRLVQEDVVFNNLGLVIVDEEQRFGVTHKEKFKEKWSGVDVLTLSATPIPRTLNMAMSGIRDMSVIETPPHDRMPVTTYVIEQDWGIIAGAINKELRRAGQVYYVHNRIDSITNCAAKIHELCPDARIGIAHGRMGEEELLKVWRRLLDREVDVLVCTTLIETGVDVPNVNTLIIENADRMGLAQLHQLRGRVGRTNRRAYAYFTFKSGKVLSEIAEKRLNAVREFTQFGSGFKIALRDLEIRGAGSVLGESQSGHMSAVGYEMYVKILGEAVKERLGGGNAENIIAAQARECIVDIKIDAFIPESYIFNQAQRISCYKRIAEIRDEDDALDVTDELIDRYGEIPKQAAGLIEVARLRNTAGSLGIAEITQDKNALVFMWEAPDMERVSRASEAFGDRLRLNLTGKTGLTLRLVSGESPLTAAMKLAKIMG